MFAISVRGSLSLLMWNCIRRKNDDVLPGPVIDHALRYMTFSFQLHVEYINCYFFVLQAMITLISKNFSVPIAEAMKYYKDKHLPS